MSALAWMTSKSASNVGGGMYTSSSVRCVDCLVVPSSSDDFRDEVMDLLVPLAWTECTRITGSTCRSTGGCTLSVALTARERLPQQRLH